MTLSINMSNYVIKSQTIHLWRIVLSELFSQIPDLKTLLSPDELERAMRFKFEIHRQRFIVSRGILRRVLSLYTDIPAQEIQFSYGKRGKPFIENHELQFNVTHSDDLAVFAITKENAIGVDIEKVETNFEESVAKRFFSATENEYLQRLPDAEKIIAFYQIWAKKEALIKALGEGLYAPLDTFSVSVNNDIETVSVRQNEELVSYNIKSFFIHPDYQAAYATNQTVEETKCWQWLHSGPSVIPRSF